MPKVTELVSANTRTPARVIGDLYFDEPQRQMLTDLHMAVC